MRFMKAITPTKSSECSILQPKFIRAGVTKSIEFGLPRSCCAREKLQPSRKRKKLEGRRLLKWSGRSAMRRVKEAIARPETEIPQRKIAGSTFLLIAVSKNQISEHA